MSVFFVSLIYGDTSSSSTKIRHVSRLGAIAQNTSVHSYIAQHQDGDHPEWPCCELIIISSAAVESPPRLILLLET